MFELCLKGLLEFSQRGKDRQKGSIYVEFTDIGGIGEDPSKMVKDRKLLWSPRLRPHSI